MIEKSKYKLLFDIDSPEDIKKFDNKQLVTLASEIREYLVDVISQVGGHFGGGLGTVELTIALHKVFNTPDDKIIWDTGHQAYPHKILTGRRDKLITIRQLNGLSGFLKRTESEYDAFGAGHASTSISAAVGFAEAIRLNEENKKVIAVIGDGAMTGGMAYEALNNAGVNKSNLIVVLNDNNMSIAPNVWQLSKYFSQLIAHPEYNKVKDAIWDFTGKLDTFGDRLRKIAAKLQAGVKSVITPGMLFEALGFRYFGPMNGHNISKLVRLFTYVKDFNEPILVHVITEKGKGYKPAEGHKQRLHGVTPFDKITGKAVKKSSGVPSYTQIFGETMREIVTKDKRVVGITAAMPDGTGLNILQEAYPKNVYDVGIAEEHAVTFSAGMACEGAIPVVAIYSTFLQRGFDQIIHDVSLQNLHVVFALDRAGLVGADGPTHHGTFDISYLRMIPNMTIMAPSNENELRNMIYTAIYKVDGPVAVRYPRGNALGVQLDEDFHPLEVGKGKVTNHGEKVAILALGNMYNYAEDAVKKLKEDNLNPTLVDMRFAKPIDEELIKELSKTHDKFVTIEENVLSGGFGSAISEFFTDNNIKADLLRIGLPNNYVEHGTQTELHRLLEIDAEGIYKKISDFI